MDAHIQHLHKLDICQICHQCGQSWSDLRHCRWHSVRELLALHTNCRRGYLLSAYQSTSTGFVSFLSSRYGRLASLAFSCAILVRLYNEIWSNSAVVGGYYGKEGSVTFIVAASFFTLVVLLYSLKGGLRSSIFTDAIQTVIFIFFLALVLVLVLPSSGVAPLLHEGSFTLAGGVDLLLVSLLQIFSYPFHDPVLTDRGFIKRAVKPLLGNVEAELVASECSIGCGCAYPQNVDTETVCRSIRYTPCCEQQPYVIPRFVGDWLVFPCSAAIGSVLAASVWYTETAIPWRAGIFPWMHWQTQIAMSS